MALKIRVPPFLEPTVSLIRETFSEWNDDNALELGAALSYYAIFSLAPLLVLAIAIAGTVYGDAAATGQLAERLRGFVGPQNAEFIQGLLANARQPSSGISTTTVLSGIFALFLATAVFAELQSALNKIWDVEPAPGEGLPVMIKGRLVSFVMVLGAGLLLLMLLVVTAGLSTAQRYMGAFAPAGIWWLADYVVSIGIVTLMLAMIFRALPDVEISWGDVWMGAFSTSLLFALGRWMISLYLGHSGIRTTFGAAGSLAVFLTWVYYTSQILFLGAEFTQVYAARYGSRIRPGEHMIEDERGDRLISVDQRETEGNGDEDSRG
jgi:membrane protein